MQQLVPKIKKKKQHQNCHLGKQKLNGIYIGRVSDNTGISSKQPEKENIYTK